MFAVARIVFAPVGGRAISRCGEVPGFCIGLAVVAASSAACAFATGFSQLLIFRAAGGLGSTIFTVSAAALVIRMSPAALRGRASGAWATGFLSGNIAGPVIGGWLMTLLANFDQAASASSRRERWLVLVRSRGWPFQ